MWPFKRDDPMTKTTTKRVLMPQRACVCGHRSYGTGAFSDLLHCNGCGAVYYIDIPQPVAKYEEVCDGNK